MEKVRCIRLRARAGMWNFREGGPVLDWPVNDVEVRVADQSDERTKDCVDKAVGFAAAGKPLRHVRAQ